MQKEFEIMSTVRDIKSINNLLEVELRRNDLSQFLYEGDHILTKMDDSG